MRYFLNKDIIIDVRLYVHIYNAVILIYIF